MSTPRYSPLRSRPSPVARWFLVLSLALLALDAPGVWAISKTPKPPRDPRIVGVRVASLDPDGPHGTLYIEVELDEGGERARWSRHAIPLAPGFPEAVADDYGADGGRVLAMMTSALRRRVRRGTDPEKACAAHAITRLEAAGLARAYWVVDGRILAPKVAIVVGKIADAYHGRTHRLITVTSGARTSGRQAAAMVRKMDLGGDIMRLYLDKRSAGEIRNAWSKAPRGRDNFALRVREVRAVIDAQIADGHYISNHLVAGAVDIRIWDMTGSQRRHFQAACDSVGGVRAIAETRPPHWHLELAGISERP